MNTNYYTYFHIAVELNRAFSEHTIAKIFTQHRGELIAAFEGTPAVIMIGCEPSNNFIYARKTFSRARRNSVDIFTGLSGAVIQKVFIHPSDRQICVHLKDGRELAVQLFGSKANVLFLDAAGNVSETFLKKPTAKHHRPGLLSPIPHPEIPQVNSFITAFGDQPITFALKKIFPQFGSTLIQELLIRVGLESRQLTSHLQENEIVRLLDGAQSLTEKLLSPPTPRIYFDGTTPVRFSTIPLQHLENFRYQNFDSVSEAIHTFCANVYHDKVFTCKKEEIIRVLARERGNTERALQKISSEAETAKRAEQYEKCGKLLMAQLHLFTKGDAVALVEDFIDNTGNLTEIPLDPHLSPSKNAERYFEKAEKSRHAEKEGRRRVAELTEQQKSISRLLERTEEIATADDLKHFAEENQKELAQFGFKTNKSGRVKKEESLPFRVFTVAGGFQVFAGKSGENNDLLSTRYTAKNDFWFHARGVGGSHVVLKVGTGKGEVSKQAIEQAAAIAAYYSKMKNSKMVPVSMCEGKHVRKPKGAPPGTVTLEREKTLFVEPGLPQT